MAAPGLSAICDRERETVESWLVAFEQAWTENALADWAADKLPATGSPVRRLALIEMVKVDLEYQWQRGNQLTLGSYLERFPELGDRTTVSAELLLAEYQIRQQFGQPVSLSEYAGRFPHQAEELSRLVQQAAALQSDPALAADLVPTASAHETSRAGLAVDTAAPAAPDARQGPTATGATPPPDLPEVFGRYRIIRPLGKGGMGVVYLAHDTQLDRQVALKVPNFSASERGEVAERFLREARAMATIRHPNLCPVYDVGQIGGIHYLTMAFIEGRLLSEYVRPAEPLPERLTATLVRKLALALHEMHARGIVHRDLKPSNIFVDQRGEPMIVDFGLARRTEHQDVALTRSGQMLGSPAYMAPEQARSQSEAVGPHSDVYSLGVIMYELLTGIRPFRGEQVLDVLGQVLTAEPEPPRVHRPGLDPRLEAICLKALAKQPADRWPTMQTLAEALGECLQPAPDGADQQLVSATRPGSHGPALATGDESSRWWAGDDGESLGLTDAFAGLSQLVRDVPASTGAESDDADRSYVIPTVDDATPTGTAPAAQAASAAAGAPPRRRIRPWHILAACGAAAALLGIVILLYTAEGTVKIELSDPQAAVEVKVNGQQIEIAGLDEPLRLRTGEHGLVVSGPDFETVTRSFTVKRGSEETLRITLVGKPAVYQVRIEPDDARLSVSGEGVSTAGDGAERTVTVANPDGHKKIVLFARKAGYQDLDSELQPSPGDTGELEFQLQPLPPPDEQPADPPTIAESDQPARADFTVQVEPPDAMLYISGAGARLDGQGARRTITVEAPDGKSPIVLVAAMEGYQNQRRELVPVLGETQTVTVQLELLARPTPVVNPQPAPPAAPKEPALAGPAPPAEPVKPPNPTGPEPPRAIAPFDAAKAKEHQQAWAKHLRVPDEIINSIGMKLTLIPPGEFMMGSKVWDRGSSEDEMPRHPVRITASFYLGTYEVTRAEFRRFVEEAEYNTGYQEWGPQLRVDRQNHPVAHISWEDATAFCQWLTDKEGQQYRLPTESQWEYACRGGTQTRFSFGEDEPELTDYAWYPANADGTTHSVGQKKPNPWGLYDMHGNVGEWCQDWYASDYYANSPTNDPQGPSQGSNRVSRGGSWGLFTSHCLASHRLSSDPGYRCVTQGFRLARTVSSPSR
jgi:formylglycine-generating enzyme required for sulfatase activity/serine/threonine protein kinase